MTINSYSEALVDCHTRSVTGFLNSQYFSPWLFRYVLQRKYYTNCLWSVTAFGLHQHWFRKWLVAWRHQAITWIIVEAMGAFVWVKPVILCYLKLITNIWYNNTGCTWGQQIWHNKLNIANVVNVKQTWTFTCKHYEMGGFIYVFCHSATFQ